MLNIERALEILKDERPDLIDLFITYVEEGDFALEILDDDLKTLSQGARLLEVGSGIGLVALTLQSRGFKVTAVEPSPSGFSTMNYFNNIIQKSWHGPIPKVTWIQATGEEFVLPDKGQYDFAYAINVIEHVKSVPQTIWNTVRHLHSDAYFHFICPNYDFPYEPHFNFPTLFSKNLTYKVMRKRIDKSGLISEPEEFWEGLSWPSPRTLRRDAVSGVEYSFSKEATKAYVARLEKSEHFSARKGKAFQRAKSIFNKVGSDWISLVPISILPVIDCKVRQRH